MEREIVAREAALNPERAGRLVKIGEKIRNLTDRGLEEGVSTRLLVYCGKLLAQGVEPNAARLAEKSVLNLFFWVSPKIDRRS